MANEPVEGGLERAVLDALRCIPDPELGIDIVELGLIDRIDVDEGHVLVRYTLTTFGCAVGPMLETQMYEVLYGIPGVTEVTPELVFDPPWTRDRMSPRARELVGDREFNPTGSWSHFAQLLANEDARRAMSDIATTPGAPEEIPFELDGVSFALRVHPDPSGLRGQVFHGEEKIAGVQIYHSTDRDTLLREARGNGAVRRWLERA